MKERTFCIVATILLLAACATAPPPPKETTPPYSEADYAKYSPGAGIVEGQAFLKTRGGQVRYAAGNAITLDPVTPVSTYWWKTYAQSWAYRNALPRAAALKHRLVQTADAEGRFRFDHLAVGQTYYLRTVLSWETGAGTTGSVIAKEVAVKEGEVTKVVLTQ